MLRDRVRTGGFTGRQYGGPELQDEAKEVSEEMNRRHNSSRCREELGPFGSESRGLEDQRRGLHSAMDG